MGLVLAVSPDGPHGVLYSLPRLINGFDCVPPISMLYDLSYEVRDTLSADLCQEQLFSKQFNNS